MAEKYSKNLLENYLKVADEALRDAKSRYNENSFRAAAHSAYYAMFYSANAALIKIGAELPRTHQGLVARFNYHYIRTKIIKDNFSDYLRTAMELRLSGDYNVTIEPDKRLVLSTINNAQEFVTTIKKIVNKK